MYDEVLDEEECLAANAYYQVWSPLDAAEAAETLMKILADVCNSQISNKNPTNPVSQS